MLAVGVWTERGGPEALDRIRGRLEREPDARVRATLIAALGQIGDSDDRRRIRPFLRDPDARICANSIEALVALGGTGDLAQWLPLLVREENRVKANLMLALYPSYPQQVMGFLRRMIRSKDPGHRASGLFCLRHVDPEDARDTLLELVGREDAPENLDQALRQLELLPPTPETARALASIQQGRRRPTDRIQKTIQSLEESLRAPPAGPEPSRDSPHEAPGSPRPTPSHSLPSPAPGSRPLSRSPTPAGASGERSSLGSSWRARTGGAPSADPGSNGRVPAATGWIPGGRRGLAAMVAGTGILAGTAVFEALTFDPRPVTRPSPTRPAAAPLRPLPEGRIGRLLEISGDRAVALFDLDGERRLVLTAGHEPPPLEVGQRYDLTGIREAHRRGGEIFWVARKLERCP